MSQQKPRQPEASGIKLNAQQQNWIRRVEANSLDITSASLQKPRRMSNLLAAVEQLHQVTDSNVDLVERGAKKDPTIPPVACKAGCSYCCQLRVGARVPEVLHIARQVALQGRTEEVLRSAVSQEARLRGLTGAARFNVPDPCPLLVGGLCSVHASRPMACRSHHSLDVQACVWALNDMGHRGVPQLLEVRAVTDPVSHGMADALTRRGLEGGIVDLSQALAIALADASAEDRWLHGEKVFASAMFTEIEQH